MQRLADWYSNLSRQRRVWLCVACWLFAVYCATVRYERALGAFNNSAETPVERHRADGNAGHMQIDFAGQWLMGKMLISGNARRLYDRRAQWPIITEAFPRTAASPWVKTTNFPKRSTASRHSAEDPLYDAEWIMYWFMGAENDASPKVGSAIAAGFVPSDNVIGQAIRLNRVQTHFEAGIAEPLNEPQVGGPLYPPIHAFVFAPISALGPPVVGYRVVQVLSVLVVVPIGFCISRLTRGRVNWPLACAAVLCFTGFRAGLDLSQNTVFSLLIVVAGWYSLDRGRPIVGGLVWGLLAYKPVWGLAFVLVPILFRQWRFTAAMVVGGLSIVALTLPVVGIQVWLDWLTVGKEANALYDVNTNWVALRRDLAGLPSRFMIDFTISEADRANPWAVRLGWLVWGVVFVGTIATVARGQWRFRSGESSRSIVGELAGFAFLGAYLCCYRFMYYDAMLAIVGLILLATQTPRWRGVVSVPIVTLLMLFVWENYFIIGQFELGDSGINTGVRYPWDTLIVVVGWFVMLISINRRREPLPG